MRPPQQPQLQKLRLNHPKGEAYEQQALIFLQRQGLTLLECNYRSRFGEIDLIMREQNTLVFVEVRYRASSRYGGAIASITVKKQEKIWLTASQYLQQRPHAGACRVDIIAFEGDAPCQWIQNAIQR